MKVGTGADVDDFIKERIEEEYGLPVLFQHITDKFLEDLAEDVLGLVRDGEDEFLELLNNDVIGYLAGQDYRAAVLELSEVLADKVQAIILDEGMDDWQAIEAERLEAKREMEFMNAEYERSRLCMKK